MPLADDKKFCPLLKKEIRRAYCMEIGDVRNDDLDIQYIEDTFDIEKANKICNECGWDNTPVL
ncbi:hypothetical protein UT300012_40560 [Paraclostridium bifermentans]